jgi:hypothetical protein
VVLFFFWDSTDSSLAQPFLKVLSRQLALVDKESGRDQYRVAFAKSNMKESDFGDCVPTYPKPKEIR